MLGLLHNNLTANCEYSRINRGNLPLPNKTKFSKKPEIFFNIFFAVLESELNFQNFKKKNEPHSSSLPEIIDPERDVLV